MFFPVEEWFPAFVLTVLVEGVIVVLAFRGFGTSLPRLAVISVAANLATHPAVWFVFTQLLLVGTPEYTLAAETWAVIVEAVIFWAVLPTVSVRRVVMVAVTANAASFVLGHVIGGLLPDLA